jgi:hypothetical protein
LPFLAKNTGPAFDRGGRGDILSARRGAALFNQKLQPVGLSDSLLYSFTHTGCGRLAVLRKTLSKRESLRV